jgi:hypothetical protein
MIINRLWEFKNEFNRKQTVRDLGEIRFSKGCRHYYSTPKRLADHQFQGTMGVQRFIFLFGVAGYKSVVCPNNIRLFLGHTSTAYSNHHIYDRIWQSCKVIN